MAGEALGPLHGVPYSVKDLTNTAGVRTTMGSAIFENNVPKEDAVAVARAKAAGAILIGKTTTPEFGHKQSTDAPIFGQTLNPIDPNVTCGASSGGAAVAVAAGMGPLALGTDGGGSIRIPAACCGIVGLKATFGGIANLQPPDLFSANSYVGPMARDVADTRLLFDVVAGPDKGDPYGQAAPSPEPSLESFKGLRVAWLERCGNRLDRRVAVATGAAVRKMEALGAIVEPIEMDFVSLEPTFLVILESAIASRVAPHLERFASRLDPHLIETVEKGLRHSAVALQNAGAARSTAFRAVQTTVRALRSDRLAGAFDAAVAAWPAIARRTGDHRRRALRHAARRLVSLRFPVQSDRSSGARDALRQDAGRSADRLADRGALACRQTSARRRGASRGGVALSDGHHPGRQCRARLSP